MERERNKERERERSACLLREEINQYTKTEKRHEEEGERAKEERVVAYTWCVS